MDPIRCHLWIRSRYAAAGAAFAATDTWRTDKNENSRRDKQSQVKRTANLVFDMLSAGFRPHEPFIQCLFRDIASTSGVFESPFKTRISLPGSAYLYAVPDPYGGIIPHNKVFVKMHGIPLPTGSRVLITRSPCMHTSHIVGLEAVNLKKLEYLDNIAVFSVQSPPLACSSKPYSSPLAQMFGQCRQFIFFFFFFICFFFFFIYIFFDFFFFQSTK